MRYFTRDGRIHAAHAAADAVNLIARGWVEADQTPPADAPPYDNGGTLPEGLSTVVNMSAEPEPVIESPAQDQPRRRKPNTSEE